MFCSFIYLQLSDGARTQHQVTHPSEEQRVSRSSIRSFSSGPHVHIKTPFSRDVQSLHWTPRALGCQVLEFDRAHIFQTISINPCAVFARHCASARCYAKWFPLNLWVARIWIRLWLFFRLRAGQIGKMNFHQTFSGIVRLVVTKRGAPGLPGLKLEYSFFPWKQTPDTCFLLWSDPMTCKAASRDETELRRISGVCVWECKCQFLGFSERHLTKTPKSITQRDPEVKLCSCSFQGNTSPDVNWSSCSFTPHSFAPLLNDSFPPADLFTSGNRFFLQVKLLSLEITLQVFRFLLNLTTFK